MRYDVDLSISLEPVWHRQPPKVIVGCDDRLHEVDLAEPTTFRFQYASSGQQTLSVNLSNKTNQDCQPALGLDMMVHIRRVEFFGITDPRFIWRSKYRPIYPEPWASGQRAQGITLAEEIEQIDCLGWNGTWRLEFDLPVFTWIHEVQNLGWIYR